MALSSALNIATSGLTASARLALTASNNLANAQTEGYGRRELTLIAGQLGGVRIGEIVRLTDQALIGDRILADAGVGQRQAGATALARIEQAFGPVGDANGVAGRLAALEQSLITAGSEPASEVRLRGVLNRSDDLIKAIRSDADTLKAQREAADQAIARDVAELNRSLQQIANLNADISRMRNSGQDPSPIIDARQRVIDKVALITPLRQIDRGNDQIALYNSGGVALIDGSPSTFSFNPTTTIMPAMTYAGGVLSGVSINGLPPDPANGAGRLRGGSLEANFVLRDQTLPELQTDLDNIAADLVRRFQDPTVDPTLAPGDPGLFTDGGGPLDPLDITGLSFRLTVNAAVDPARGGALSQLRDGINAVVPGPIGDPAQLDRWLGALRSTSAVVPGGAARTLAGHAADLIADLGDRRLYAEENLSFAVARQEALKTAELADGVDSDFELQNLLRIEQAYAANARVLQTIDAMMQRLSEI